MTQAELVKEFVAGCTDANNDKYTYNLKIRGDVVIHYTTVIAQRYESKIIINMTRYSLVTGRVQKMLRESVPVEKQMIVTGIPEGTKSLVEYLDIDN